MNLPELKRNPFVGRVMDILDKDQNGEVDFKEFIEGISQFSVKGGKTEKLRFVFRWNVGCLCYLVNLKQLINYYY